MRLDFYPTVLMDGQMYFGQDRPGFVEEAMTDQ